MSEIKNIQQKPSTQTPPKAPPHPVETKPAEPKKLSAVFGRMVHPYTHQVFEQGEPTSAWTIDNWLEVQIEHGKLIYVE